MTIPESNQCLLENLKFEERNKHIDPKYNLDNYFIIHGKYSTFIKMSDVKMINHKYNYIQLIT